MDIAVIQVYNILNESELMKDVDIYTNSIPTTSLVVPKLPLARIVELEGGYTISASDIPRAITFYVQLDLWVKELKDINTYYFSIDKLMRLEGWECTYTEQTDDPDLQNCKRIIKRYEATLQLEI